MALALEQHISLGDVSGYPGAGKCLGLVSIVPKSPAVPGRGGWHGKGTLEAMLLFKPVA